MAFRGLQAESISQGAAHEAASKELYALVAEPFEAWCQGYKVGYITLVKHGIPLVEQDCIKDKLEKHKTMLFEQWIESYEVSIEDVSHEIALDSALKQSFARWQESSQCI